MEEETTTGFFCDEFGCCSRRRPNVFSHNESRCSDGLSGNFILWWNILSGIQKGMKVCSFHEIVEGLYFAYVIKTFFCFNALYSKLYLKILRKFFDTLLKCSTGYYLISIYIYYQFYIFLFVNVRVTHRILSTLQKGLVNACQGLMRSGTL